MNRTDRLYALVEELRATAPRARASPRLAERFEVSVRTIERDILALQEAGVPIWATPGPGGGYTIDPAHTLPPLNFSASEAAAIALALARSGPMPFDRAARTALHKVVAAMSATGRTSAADLLARIHLLHAKRELSDAPVLRAVCSSDACSVWTTATSMATAPWHDRSSRSASSAPSATGTWWGGAGCAATCACSDWTGSARSK